MAIITVMILLSGILSVIFIKKYYYNELKNNLIQTYQECDAFFKDSSNKNRDGSYDLDSMESLLENKSDAMIYIVDDVHMKIYTTVNEDTAVFNNLKSIGEFLMFSDSIDANNSQIEREEVEKHKVRSAPAVSTIVFAISRPEPSSATISSSVFPSASFLRK